MFDEEEEEEYTEDYGDGTEDEESDPEGSAFMKGCDDAYED